MPLRQGGVLRREPPRPLIRCYDAPRESRISQERGMQVRLDGRTALITGGSLGVGRAIASRFAEAGARVRSEEHTSELQSLMRISSAVFCLKNKKQTHPQ